MKLLQQFEVVARRRRLAQNTIDVYLHWIKQFLTFCAANHESWKHPAELGTADVEEFLNDVVVRRRLSASAQNQALCALVFLYSHVLADVIPADHLGKFLLQRSRRPKRVPTVLSADEVRRVFAAIPDDHICRLPIELMYGTGMRVSEVCTLRGRDIDLGRAQIIVRAGWSCPIDRRIDETKPRRLTRVRQAGKPASQFGQNEATAGRSRGDDLS